MEFDRQSIWLIVAPDRTMHLKLVFDDNIETVLLCFNTMLDFRKWQKQERKQCLLNIIYYITYN